MSHVAASDPDLTLVIAVFNERESLPRLIEEIKAAMSLLPLSWEVLLIDDGSNDGSRDIERQIAKDDAHFRAVQFRRNFGKAAALDCGFRLARGSIVVTLDADLQDDPADIARLIAPIQDGSADLVSGWKFPRRDPIGKTIPSKIYNFVTRVSTGLDLHDMNCGLKAYRSEVVKELWLYGEMHRYIPVLAAGAGFSVTEVKSNHRSREFGHSKYAWARFLRGFFDLLTVLFLTKYRRRPLHLIGGFGVLLGFIGGAMLSYLAVLKLLGEAIGHRPMLAVGILLVLLSVQFFTFGLLAEMLTYYHHRGRGDYTILARYGFDSDPS